MRFLVITTLLLCVAFVACGGDSESDPDEALPIMYAMTYIQNEASDQVEPRGVVLLEEGAHACLLPANASSYLQGTCEWEVEQGRGNWGVIYTESWKCADFLAAFAADAVCPGEMGHHYWKYGVGIDGSTQLLVEYGAPQPESLAARADTGVPIMYAMTYIQNETSGQVEPRGVIPPKTGKQDCLIPATTSRHIEGTCEWKTSPVDDGGWDASYFETWKCEDYNALAGNSDSCPGETGTHRWDYQIAPDGTVMLLVHEGEPPPEGLGAGAPSQ